MEALRFEWTEYMKHRALLRGFNLVEIEHIVRHSAERYIDQSTGRLVAVGRGERQMLLIPYELDGILVRPITVHATTKLQIDARVKSGRFSHE